MVSDIELFEDLQRTYDRIGIIPTARLHKKHGKHHPCTFRRKFGSWNSALYQCFQKVNHESPVPRTENTCRRCGNKTYNPDFCSQSCAATYHNNEGVIGRRKSQKCSFCGKLCYSHQMYCDDCSKLTLIKTSTGVKRIEEVTKRDMRTKYGRHRISHHARSVAQAEGLLDQCSICGYSTYVECAHKKAVADFDDDALLIEINHPNNLTGLCPNHHWEFDHDILYI